MNLLPLNRHIIVSQCEDPRTEGRIHSVRGQDASVMFGVVEAMDESDPPTPYPCKVGEIVYFPAGAAKRVIVDGGIAKAIIHVAQLFGVCRDAVAKSTESEVAVQIEGGGKNSLIHHSGIVH